MAAKTLRVNIVGDSKSAEKALGAVASRVTGTSSAMGRVGSTLAGVGSAVSGVASTVANFATSGAQDFADWASQVALVQKTMGGTTEEASRLAYQAKILGVDSQDLALGMRFLGKDITNGGKGLAKLGIDTKDASGHIKSMPEILKEVSAKIQSIPPGAQRTAEILSIFGKRGMALTPILTANAAQMDALGQESDALGYTLDSKATASVKTHAQEQRRMQAAFGAVKMQIGESLMPVLTDLGKMFAEHIVPVIKDVVKWTKDHEGVVKVLVVGLAAFVVAMKAINAGMAAYRAIMLIVRGVTIAYTAVQWLLNVAMTANPIGLIIVAIVALIAIFVVLWNKCAWFRDFWKAVWNGIKAVAVAIWNFLKDHFKLIITIILSLMTGGLFFLITHWRQIWNGIKAVFVAIWDFIKDHFKQAMMIVGTILTGGLLFLITHWRQVWGAIKAFFSAIWDGIKSILSTVLGWIKGVWNSVWNGIKAFFVGIWDGIKGAFQAAVDWIKGRAEAFVNFWKAIPGKIKNLFKGMWDGIKDAFKDAINWIIRGWNKLHFDIPKVHIPLLGDVGGGTIGLPHIDELAKGGTITSAGMALVGEQGPELLNLPRGASVTPLPRGGHGGDTYVVNIHVAGNVRADHDLAKTITPIMRDELLRLSKRNGGRGGLVPA